MTYSIPKSIVTIGTFDGVHIGHQKIIAKLTQTAQEKQLKSTVLTFFPHPRMVLQKNANIQLLNTIHERKELLNNFGVEDIYIQEFTKEFSELSAENFVKTLLVEKLNAQHIIIGYDHQFGKNRSAGIEDLKIFGTQFGFDVEEISVQDVDDVAVSSTKIRNALNHGDVSTANSYLGYSYFLTGTVIKGKGLGRQIDFPTANISIKESYKLIPKQGVYVVKTTVENSVVFGMMNIGTNPTVNGKEQSIEVHLFDFNADIYGEILKVELLHRLRDEHHFKSLDDLKTQLHQDKKEALNLIAATNE